MLIPTPTGVALAAVQGFFKAYGKPLLIVLAAGVSFWAFSHWLAGVKDTAEKKGFSVAEAQYKAAVTAANERAARDDALLTKFSDKFDMLGSQREAGITVKVEPMLERMKDEIASNPVYRDCAVSDGMRAQINAGRAAVDASIGSSNPTVPGR